MSEVLIVHYQGEPAMFLVCFGYLFGEPLTQKSSWDNTSQALLPRVSSSETMLPSQELSSPPGLDQPLAP